jgi:hypothetical protein
MDASSINASSSLITSLSADNTAGTFVLKKAMQIQEESAAQLINSLPQPAKTSPGSTLGSNIDTKA